MQTEIQGIEGERRSIRGGAIPASWIAGFSHFVIISCKLLYRLA